ncbi:vacuolar protein sorting/targeting protein PEP1 [Aspergillus nanangensis]|uniref:Vacuolar protein sorting/targeting protein 10 n=1 Tax=Aspergillus nanangensis TaxID=2582783 RepID=A0AAD4CMX9_ASPNN|nr:vacuolar protein sorting/targeting protein PEP1 [Aspergillus nanangensis]
MRWLALVACLVLVFVTQPGAAKKSDEPKVAAYEMDSPPLSLFYFEDTETILMNTMAGELLLSVDGGNEWNVVEGENGDMKSNVLMVLQHPYDAHRAYALSKGGPHWITTDQAKTWRPFKIPEHPAYKNSPLVFHGWDSSKVIFQTDECVGRYCIVKSWYTDDDFKSHHDMRESVGGCSWAAGHPQFAEDLDVAKEIRNRSLCVVPGLKVPLPYANRLVYSDNYFQDDKEGTEVKLQEGRPVSGVMRTAAIKKFIVAAARSRGTDELALYVTVDTKNWHRAEFEGHRLAEDAYTMLESTNHSLEVDVLTNPKDHIGVLFTSNSDGTYFTRNIQHTNRDKFGTVDFEKIANIEGVIVVNVVDNPTEVESGAAEKRKVTKISFNDGLTFDSLTVGGENLHLHSVTSYANIGRVLSSPAPGLVMGIGNTGKKLGHYDDGDLYVSDDAGLTWRLARENSHKYEFGDQGAVLVAIRDKEKEKFDELVYSIDHGKKWDTLELKHKIYPRMVTTTPDSTSLKFLVVGPRKSNGRPEEDTDFIVYAVDFKGLHERKCEKDDFDPKWPARLDENGEPDCLMGRKQFFRRRKADADCFVDEEFKDAPEIFELCKCTAQDFECEYKHNEDGKGCALPTSLTPPDGQCKKPTDKFKGPSGYRLIPGNECIREGGENLDEDIERSCEDMGNVPKDGDISVKKHSFDSDPHIYRYMERQSSSSGDDETVFLLTKEGDFHISHNHGKTWEQPLKGKSFAQITLHPYNSDMAFLLTDGTEGLWTVDRGHTFNPFKTVVPPNKERYLSPLVFHPQHKDWLLWIGAADECKSDACHNDAYFSKNRGASWDLLLRYVRKCEFESSEFREESEKRVFCEQHKSENLENPLQLRSSDNFFDDSEVRFEETLVSFATMSEFIVVASRDQNNTDALVASSSIDGKEFAEAKFPPNLRVPIKTAFTVLESSTHAIFLHVKAGSTSQYGPIIKSNSNGTSYVLSLDAVNENRAGFADFEKMQGLEGVAVVNTVSNVGEEPKETDKKLKTMITHNDGAQWSLVPPPAKDADGKGFSCSVVDGKGTADCSLHLHGYTERKDERDTFSSGSAIGLMVANGNVGDRLLSDEDADTFITKDGGITWKSARKGKHMWEFGDSGSVIVLVPDSKATQVLYYSLDEGDSWKEFRFSDMEMRIDDITTLPSDTSKNFLLWGRDGNKPVTVNVDFSGLRSRTCKLVEDEDDNENDDYVLWEPKHPFQDDNCLFGHVEQYHRKKPTADCWNNWREPHVHRVGKNCTCTRADFECDYNYEPQNDGSCRLVPGLQMPDAEAVCREDPERIEYWSPSGLRRIPLTTCQENAMDHGDIHPCPSKEKEFDEKHGISGVGLFFAIVIPIIVAGAIGYFVFTRWDGKFGQIRLGESTGTPRDWLSRDSLLVTVPIAIIAGIVAVGRALPLLAVSIWRSASGYMRLGGSRGYSRPYASRGSFAARRGDYTSVVDDEDELLGVDDVDDDDEN